MICSPNEQFECQKNECISWSFVCDGIAHCSNKADEDCDMCTNDLYQCKDLSRINCTRACTTLGYIPCKNYMDTKICASVVKALQSKWMDKGGGGGGKLSEKLLGDKNQPGQPHGPVLSSSFLENIKNMNRKLNDQQHSGASSSSFFSSETVFFSMIGLFFVLSIVIFLVVFGVFFNRFRRAKKRSTSSSSRNTSSSSSSPLDHNQIVVSGRDGLLTYPLSSSSSSSLSYPSSPLPKTTDTVVVEDLANSRHPNHHHHLVKTSSNEIYYKNNSNRAFAKATMNANCGGKETKYPRPKRPNGKRHTTTDELPRLATAESNNSMMLIDTSLAANDDGDEFKSTDLIDMDDMDFSEPPPPYKLSKYFPKVDPSMLTTATSANDDGQPQVLVHQHPSAFGRSGDTVVSQEDPSHEYEIMDDFAAMDSPYSSTYRHQTSRPGGKAQRNPLRKSHSTSRSATGTAVRTHRTTSYQS